jgi:hypothetical protein
LVVSVPDSFVEKVFSIIFSPCNKKKGQSDSIEPIELKTNDPGLIAKIKDSNENKHQTQTKKTPSDKFKNLWLNATNRIQMEVKNFFK